MRSVIITTSSFGSSMVLERGQSFFIPIAAGAGCTGIEIRRELFGKGQIGLQELRNLAEKEDLSLYYSAPVELWLENGELNASEVRWILRDGLELGAVLIKTSLGFYHPGRSDLSALKQLLLELRVDHQDLQLTVENDQTPPWWKLTITAAIFYRL